MAIRNVFLVGANGNLGAQVLKALITEDYFHVTVLQRKSSQSTPGLPCHIVRVSDGWDTGELTAALTGADAVIACFPLRSVDEHLRLADAAAAAGVQRFIPADFGSCDSRSPRARELVPLFEKKVQVRRRLEDLAAQCGSGGFSWTSIVCGHFFDWGLREGFLHVDLAAKHADILDRGLTRSSTSTLARVAESVVRVLRMPAETCNRVLMVQSFCVSQMDIIRALERVTQQKWEVHHLEAEPFIEKHKALAHAGDKQSIEELVFALGAVDGNWEGADDFAMGLLGLENEDLDVVVGRVVSAAE